MVEEMEIQKGFQKTEVGVIPSDWEVQNLEFVAEIIMGQSPKGSSYNRSEIGFALINGPTEFTDRFPIKIQWTSEPTKFSQSGDILLCVRGSSTGKMNIANDKYCIGRGVSAIRAKDNCIQSLLEYLTRNAVQSMLSKTTGSTFPNIDGKSLRSILVPFPPARTEQIAIATALNDADALITQLEKLIAKKRNIKQGAMQELLRPKEGWEVKKMGEVFKFLNTANNARDDLLESGEVEYIHYGDIHTRWDCFLDCAKNELPFIDKGKIVGVPLLENGDLVVTDASEDYDGLAACIELKNIGKREIIAGLHTLLLRGNKNILADGFKGYLRNYKGVKDAIIRVSTGVSVFGISKTNLKNIEIPIPSTKEEQTRIAQILSDMDDEIDALEKKLEKYKMIKQGMMQNLLTGKIRLM